MPNEEKFFSPPLFPMSGSQKASQVPKLFSIALQIYPIWFAKGRSTREHICFYIAIEGPKGCSYWGVPNVPKTIEDGLNNMTPYQKKKVVSAPMN